MIQSRKILVTAALPYANGPIHLGHVLGYVRGDIWVRFQNMIGNQCTYICGSDAHGTPIMLKAEEQGIDAEELVANMRNEHQKDFADFHIQFDNFYTTHSPENRELVESIFHRLMAHGHITKKTIKQAYDPVKNMFLPDRYVKGGCPKCGAEDQYGDSCEVCGATYNAEDLIDMKSVITGSKPIQKESEHFFFRLSEYHSQLQDWVAQGHLQTEIANKLQEWFEVGLKDWDISRDAPYFGFEIPESPGQYFYVWLDAPVGYMASFKNLCARRDDLSFMDYWGEKSDAELYHFVGKDIVYFHSLFWPATLMGAGYRTPTSIITNGFLTVNGTKMSKSRGTFITARDYLKHFNPDCLRYYFAAKLNSHVEDFDLNLEDFAQRVNSDLVGKVINIASRCGKFIDQYHNHQLSNHNVEAVLYNEFVDAGFTISELFEQREFAKAIREIMHLADRANQYVDDKKPWQLIKDPANKRQVQEICTVGINLFRVIITYLKPIIPTIAEHAERYMRVPPLTWDNRVQPLLNHVVNPFTPILQRIDPKQLDQLVRKEKAKQKPKSAKSTKAHDKKYIKPEDFAKVDLRVARITHAEHVPDADKLLKLTVDVGGESKQVFSGIKSAYEPEKLIGRLTIMVANLAPKKMRFGTSEGMILVASGKDGDDLWLLAPDEGAEPGSRVI